MTPNEAALSELISLAHRRGGISMEDVRKTLPIESMTADDISRVVARLDEAGFDLEIDPELIGPEDKATSKVAPAAKLEQTVLPEIEQQESGKRTGLPTSAGESIMGGQTVQRSESATSASSLPWVLAFAIVVFAVFAAFAF